MFDQPFGFYVGLYICGVAVAIIIHKVYFALHPELKWENIQKEMQAKGDAEHGRLSHFDEEEDIFSPLSDQSIKMMIWLSWLSVALWFFVFCLTLLEMVSNLISRFFKALTDKIL